MDSIGLYVHIPFCPHKCGYCAFNSYPAMAHLHADFVEALERDLREAADRYPEVKGRAVETVFVGGGTPSLLDTPLLVRVLRAIRAHFPLTPDAEVTMEANPGTLTPGKLAAARAEGVNRVSFGAQSFDEGELRFLERVHGPSEISDAVAAARAAGFDNVNLDLIFSLPGQTVERWTANLERAIALGPDHLSAYDLTIEEGTTFEAKVRAGAFRVQDEELCRNHFDAAIDRLASAGYDQYEISNYARAGRECRHNRRYWRHEEYLGVGPGSHSFLVDRSSDRENEVGVDLCARPMTGIPLGDRGDGHAGPPLRRGRRFSSVKKPAEYIRRVQSGETREDSTESLTADQLAFEAVFLGLRTREGIDLDRFAARYGWELSDRRRAQIDRWSARDFLRLDGRHLRLTREGLARADQVSASFL